MPPFLVLSRKSRHCLTNKKPVFENEPSDLHAQVDKVRPNRGALNLPQNDYDTTWKDSPLPRRAQEF